MDGAFCRVCPKASVGVHRWHNPCNRLRRNRYQRSNNQPFSRVNPEVRWNFEQISQALLVEKASRDEFICRRSGV